MSVRVHRSEQTRHLVLYIGGGESLLQVLAARLNDEQVASGWLRGSGVLADVELRAFDARLGRLGAARRIAGPVHAISLESSIGLVDGAPAFSLRAVLAREGDGGLETLAGEIVGARAIAVEALVTALDDLTLGRSVDETGVALLDATDRGGDLAPVAAPPSRSVSVIQPTRSPPGSAGGWSNALEASTQTDRDPGAQSRAGAVGAPMPQRPARPGKIEVDAPVPEPGDVVDHFAFGRCDVIKSDGDRLHLRVHKDGRIREIALEMLRVTPLEEPGEPGIANVKSDENNPPARRFKLERRI